MSWAASKAVGLWVYTKFVTEILADFARKYAIGYPLLSDCASEVIPPFRHV